MTPRPTSARIVIIGDEILTGKVPDGNGPWALRRLRRLGVRCTGVATVPDEVDRIAAAVAEAAREADVVFTSGGVGPTHDDVTIEGVAAAFGLPVVVHPLLEDLILNHWPGEPTPARLRMARVPQLAEVRMVGRLPLVSVRNVHVMPGVPELFRSRFEALQEGLRGPRRACSAVRTRQGESEIAEHLEAIVGAFPGVAVGSYPRWGDSPERVLLTIEGDDEDTVRAAAQALADGLDPTRLLGIDHDHHPEDDD